MINKELTHWDRDVYEWQMNVPGFGEDGQKILKGSSVLISRCGGLGGMVAYMLAAAGVGRLVIYHGGNVKPSDLNRQILMTEDWVGKPRIDSIKKRLHQLNSKMEITAVDENISDENAMHAVTMADIVVDCAPLFQERFAMHYEAVKQRKPIIECAMYNLEAQITSIIPGKTACLRCLYPEIPPAWKRQFPVFGAVSGSAGCLAAMEVIKILCGLGEPLYNVLLKIDTSDMTFRRIKLKRREDCKECGGLLKS
jgi:molybdopterin/thiamine biosynthesis adenylyltransferase